MPREQEPEIIDIEPTREGDDAAPRSEERAIVLFNRSEDIMDLTVEADPGAYAEAWPGDREQQVEGTLTVQLLPLGASVWLREAD